MTNDHEKLSRPGVVGPDQDVISAMSQGEDESSLHTFAADMRSDIETDGDEQARFDHLPKHVWLKIMSCLGVRDRVAVSLTGRTLHNMCTSSSILWRTATIRLENRSPDEAARLNAVERSALLAHSHQIKSAVIDLFSERNLFVERSTHYSLIQAVQSWPLERLEIRCDVKVEDQPPVDLPLDVYSKDILSCCLTSSSVSQLSCLKLWSPSKASSHWVDMRLVSVLQNAPFTASLTHAHIGVSMSCLNCLNDTCRVLGRFNNLQYLVVPNEWMSDVLVDNLPSGLKEIHFIVSHHSLKSNTQKWSQVLVKYPQLIIGFIYNRCLLFCSDTPGCISPRIHPVPISSIRLQDVPPADFKCHVYFLALLPAIFPQLRVLQCGFPKLSCEGLALITAVMGCPMLDHLTFSGCVDSYTVVSLAKMRKWREFEFDATSIVVTHRTDRITALKALSVQVSGILGRDWEPRRQKSPTDAPLSGMGLSFQAGVLPPLTVVDLYPSAS